MLPSTLIIDRGQDVRPCIVVVYVCMCVTNYWCSWCECDVSSFIIKRKLDFRTWRCLYHDSIMRSHRARFGTTAKHTTMKLCTMWCRPLSVSYRFFNDNKITSIAASTFSGLTSLIQLYVVMIAGFGVRHAVSWRGDVIGNHSVVYINDLFHMMVSPSTRGITRVDDSIVW